MHNENDYITMSFAERFIELYEGCPYWDRPAWMDRRVVEAQALYVALCSEADGA